MKKEEADKSLGLGVLRVISGDKPDVARESKDGSAFVMDFEYPSGVTVRVTVGRKSHSAGTATDVYIIDKTAKKKYIARHVEELVRKD